MMFDRSIFSLPVGEGLGSAARSFPLYLWERGTEGVRECGSHAAA
jgi:hypothetical protein